VVDRGGDSGAAIDVIAGEYGARRSGTADKRIAVTSLDAEMQEAREMGARSKHSRRATRVAPLPEGGIRESCFCGAHRIVAGPRESDWGFSERKVDFAVEAILDRYRSNNPHGGGCRCDVCVLARHILERRQRKRRPE
jgi:hypothetical protein